MAWGYSGLLLFRAMSAQAVAPIAQEILHRNVVSGEKDKQTSRL